MHDMIDDSVLIPIFTWRMLLFSTYIRLDISGFSQFNFFHVHIEKGCMKFDKDFNWKDDKGMIILYIGLNTCLKSHFYFW
jgi:hypothetical protein